MFDSRWHFDGAFNFSPICEEKSVPQALLSLVSMMFEGPSIDVQSLPQNVPAATTIAQLVVFNSVQHKHSSSKRVTTSIWHDKNQEMPLPLYVGLAIHAATRKKG
jgi:hypothetical protein